MPLFHIHTFPSLPISLWIQTNKPACTASTRARSNKQPGLRVREVRKDAWAACRGRGWLVVSFGGPVACGNRCGPGLAPVAVVQGQEAPGAGGAVAQRWQWAGPGRAGRGSRRPWQGGPRRHTTLSCPAALTRTHLRNGRIFAKPDFGKRKR